MSDATPFTPPGRLEAFLNAAIGRLAALGLGPSYVRQLEVRGRKSGKIYTLPVDLLEHRDALYLVAPRGRTQWVRNAEAQGSVVLRRGRRADRYRLRPLAAAEKPEVLKQYLDRFHGAVQRFFPVPAGSPPEALAEVADRYPAFELLPDA